MAHEAVGLKVDNMITFMISAFLTIFFLIRNKQSISMGNNNISNENMVWNSIDFVEDFFDFSKIQQI